MDDLATRTVAQLKALCKELGVKGYAKLPKAALIEKLTALLAGTKSGAAGSTPSPASELTAMHPTIEAGLSSNLASRSIDHGHAPQRLPANATDKDAVFQAALPSSSSSTSSWAPDLHTSLSLLPSKPTCDEKPSKRRNELTNGLAKRRKVDISSRNPETASIPKSVFKVPEPPHQPALPAQTRDSSSSASMLSAKSNSSNVLGPFKPLPLPPPARLSVSCDHRDPLAKVPLPSSTFAAREHLHLKPAAPFKPLRPLVLSSGPIRDPAPLAAQLLSDNSCSANTDNLQLDFNVEKFPPLLELAPRPISLPMKLRQRPLARKWAVLLTRLSDSERSHVFYVSKGMRYAVYLSASHILRVDFPGARLASYLRSVRDSEVMDLWPYLRARQEEVSRRRAAYDASFLPRLYESQDAASPVAPVLWTSPDHEDQLTVVLRFLAAKAWFSISLPGSPERIRKWLGATVTDAQEVSKGAVWTITQTQLTGESETLYVLYETCEVISSTSSSGPLADVPVRHDWAQHIAALPSASERDSLLDLVMWHNGEEYERGISKLWLRRVPADDTRRRVAERYVLACVAPNSVSGTYKTARQMADEFASLGSSTDAQKTAARPSLYLPEHHYVESVSFIAARPVGKPLHPALAAVQTPGREYIILRDTGMHVGCEEEGVAEVWMKILRCDPCGIALGP